jgi:hypothetical protein
MIRRSTDIQGFGLDRVQGLDMTTVSLDIAVTERPKFPQRGGVQDKSRRQA